MPPPSKTKSKIAEASNKYLSPQEEKQKRFEKEQSKLEKEQNKLEKKLEKERKKRENQQKHLRDHLSRESNFSKISNKRNEASFLEVQNDIGQKYAEDELTLAIQLLNHQLGKSRHSIEVNASDRDHTEEQQHRVFSNHEKLIDCVNGKDLLIYS